MAGRPVTSQSEESAVGWSPGIKYRSVCAPSTVHVTLPLPAFQLAGYDFMSVGVYLRSVATNVAYPSEDQ